MALSMPPSPSAKLKTLIIPLGLFHHQPGTRFSRIPAARQWTRHLWRSRYYWNRSYTGITPLVLLCPPRGHSVVPLRPRTLPPNPPLRPLLQPRWTPSPLPPPPAIMTSTVTTRATPDSSSPPSPSAKTVRVVIKGRVQGVFYRDWTVENATQLGLKGWVRNRRDGSVEALFSGDAVKVQEMEQRCRCGPRDAMVTGFQVFPSEDYPGTQFERKQTV